MKSISGKTTSTKEISLSKASKVLSNFVNAGTGASQVLSSYLRRASASYDDLVRLHKDLKASNESRENSSKKRTRLVREKRLNKKRKSDERGEKSGNNVDQIPCMLVVEIKLEVEDDLDIVESVFINNAPVHSVKLREMKPGILSQELKEALGMAEGAPPPWLINIQSYGPPPYPHLKIPGLNAPIPPRASYFWLSSWRLNSTCDIILNIMIISV
ncbi:hypothetical protein RHSIM_RhsimUnG0043300 [Rhododendron simsii]|uniref:PSP proline-rich domain-containing protein n=1 Tax=Rhododendron simsii TaxID=118357 RepID=A0A834FVT2_RHOSS|nr:hypothetical protein RHSIM_RhsimUnG0043300 [Rhododendron simsii]